MAEFIDSYYLVDKRKLNIVYDFFKEYQFLKNELAEDYPVPQYSEVPENIFFSDIDLLLFLETNPNCDYLVYWENKKEDSIIKQVTLQYTNDGKMIIGVSIVGVDIYSTDSIQLFKRIKKYLNSSEGCITSNEPPPLNSIEFIEFCKLRYVPMSSG